MQLSKERKIPLIWATAATLGYLISPIVIRLLEKIEPSGPCVIGPGMGLFLLLAFLSPILSVMALFFAVKNSRTWFLVSLVHALPFILLVCGVSF